MSEKLLDVPDMSNFDIILDMDWFGWLRIMESLTATKRVLFRLPIGQSFKFKRVSYWGISKMIFTLKAKKLVGYGARTLFASVTVV